MKPTNHELEAISVRRAKVADAGKVRYRVYSNPAEYVAVIADSALMAVKVSGITKPYKIMRDLPTDMPLIEPEKLAPREESTEQVAFAIGHIEKPAMYFTELPPQNDAATGEQFVPLDIKDLQSKGANRIRILSPEMVNKIIEEHARQFTHAPEVPPEAEHETVMVSPPEPLLTPEEKVTQMANEILPAVAAEASPPSDTATLSPEEVEKLLNG